MIRLLGFEISIQNNHKKKIEKIKNIACNFYGVSKKQTFDNRKFEPFVHVRQVVQYFAIKYKYRLYMNLTQIGERTNRDHSTVINSYKKIDSIIQRPLNKDQQALKIEIEQIDNKINKII